MQQFRIANVKADRSYCDFDLMEDAWSPSHKHHIRTILKSHLFTDSLHCHGDI